MASEIEASEALNDELRTAWHHYVDALVPLRPALYAYCRRLAGSLWDAEDLVQDTLLRAFGQWGVTRYVVPPAPDQLHALAPAEQRSVVVGLR